MTRWVGGYLTPKGETIALFDYSSKNISANERHVSVHVSSERHGHSMDEVRNRDRARLHILITFTSHKSNSEIHKWTVSPWLSLEESVTTPFNTRTELLREVSGVIVHNDPRKTGTSGDCPR